MWTVGHGENLHVKQLSGNFSLRNQEFISFSNVVTCRPKYLFRKRVCVVNMLVSPNADLMRWLQDGFVGL